MKLTLTLLFLSVSLFFKAQISYNFSALAGVFTPNAAPTVLHASGVDDATSAATNIGFTFQYGCVNYTQFKASSNGWLTFNTAVVGTNLFNDLNTSTDRPIIAPLWDDLAVGTGGTVNYRLTGVFPNRILTIEWLNMEWSYSATNPVISFQVKLYETSNRIEFIYRQEPAAVVPGGASIGISGTTSGDYYSLNNSSAAPVASKIVENTNIATKPATGQIYRWDPVTCTGPPAAGTAVASPSSNCTTYTTALSLTGNGSGCGMTYQWQSATAFGGPYTNIGGAVNITYTATVASTTYYRCVLTCSGFSTASAPATATIAALGVCAICNIISVASLPYSQTGQTTCGQGNDVTSTNVTNVCGSSLYYGGEDVVYSYTATATGLLNINVTSTGSYMGVTLYQGCPISGGTCVGNAQGFSGNQNLCANVTMGQVYYIVLDSYPSPTCNPYDIGLSFTSNAISCNLSAYSAAPTLYNFEVFAGTTLPTTDDVLFSTIAMFGFQFCYGGSAYWGGYPASNSSFVFDGVPCFPNIQTSTYAAAGVSTGYSIANPAPINGTSIPRNAVLGPWHDIDPSSTAVIASTKIQYTTLGIAPNRRFVLSFEDIPMYSAACEGTASKRFSGQIKLFETTNAIEIHVKNKRVCATWNNGEAILGLHSFDGTTYIPPVNATVHNAVGGVGPYNQWIMTNTAYRFSAPCASVGICAVLPVSFKNFFGQNHETYNKVNFETAEESNIDYFYVERSNDAINFNKIATLLPNNKPSNYNYLDYNYKKGMINYYRITAVEKSQNAKSTYILPLSDDFEDLSVSDLAPNPTTNDFKIVVNSKKTKSLTVSIKDLFGRVIKSLNQTINVGLSTINISDLNLQSGVYIVELNDEMQKTIAQQKLIISN